MRSGFALGYGWVIPDLALRMDAPARLCQDAFAQERRGGSCVRTPGCSCVRTPECDCVRTLSRENAGVRLRQDPWALLRWHVVTLLRRCACERTGGAVGGSRSFGGGTRFMIPIVWLPVGLSPRRRGLPFWTSLTLFKGWVILAGAESAAIHRSITVSGWGQLCGCGVCIQDIWSDGRVQG